MTDTIGMLQQEIARLEALNGTLQRERDAARIAAEKYHSGWHDEWSYWKQERDEAWAVAREILAELGYPHRVAQFEAAHPQLKEEPGSQ